MRKPAWQLAIVAGVRALLAGVDAIDLDDELDAWSQEVSDEKPGDGLPGAETKRELASLESGTKRPASESVGQQRC